MKSISFIEDKNQKKVIAKLTLLLCQSRGILPYATSNNSMREHLLLRLNPIYY